MLDAIINDLPTHGPWGMLAAVLLAANIVQWKRGVKERDDFSEKLQGFISVLVEINVFVRAKMK